ncbi:hypothetical protein [Chamaesiphon polymorphus]|uniref:Uncharacterized protein n=1 Tax=Chamaesiphon polymorphus CCALA 037 TaxID=2107692 RepID=A0A2T1G2A9_9CYAN|nr:hypothetical protein [Chamaesiphon polymorphus]PSB51384.1 hypothetical protein C7B77_21645 [Chamaesiphon polymorphus CCALA 037]
MKKQAIYQSSIKNTPFRQGEILTDIFQYYPIANEIELDNTELSFVNILHPYVIVVTQDCDLDWDYQARISDNRPDKLLNSIILCEVATAQEVRGTAEMNSKEWNLVSSQRHERYYFFEKIPKEFELEKEGLPELTADFKRIFGIEAAILYRQLELGMAKRRSVLSSPYLEHFSRRYHSFQGRVALPYQYESAKEG